MMISEELKKVKFAVNVSICILMLTVALAGCQVYMGNITLLIFTGIVAILMGMFTTSLLNTYVQYSLWSTLTVQPELGEPNE